MEILNRHFFKFLFGLFAFIAIGLGVAYGLPYYRRAQNHLQAQEAANRLTSGSSTLR